MKKLTQNQQILNHLLEGGNITQLEALMLFNCFRLASRINDLKREGHNIKSKMIYYDKKKFSVYWIEK